jgi:hypothetical protein
MARRLHSKGIDDERFLRRRHDCSSGQNWIELKLLTRLKLSLSRMFELKQNKEITYQYCTSHTPRAAASCHHRYRRNSLMLSDGEVLSFFVGRNPPNRPATLSLSDDGVFIPARFAKETAASATLYPCSTTPLSLFSGEFKSTYCDHHCLTASRMGAEWPETGTIDVQCTVQLLLIGLLEISLSDFAILTANSII